MVFRAEALDVRLAEILKGPVFCADRIVGEESCVVLLRKGLVREEGQRMIGGCPFASRSLAAQTGNRSSPRIQRKDEMRCLHFLPRGWMRQLRCAGLELVHRGQRLIT